MKKITPIILALFLISCYADKKKNQLLENPIEINSNSYNLERDLFILDCIGKVHSFREAIPVAENMIKRHDSPILKMELSEYYMFEYLVDGEAEGMTKSIQLWSKALEQSEAEQKISTFLNREVELIKKIKVEWFLALERDNKDKLEELLIWSLMEDLDP